MFVFKIWEKKNGIPLRKFVITEIIKYIYIKAKAILR